MSFYKHALEEKKNITGMHFLKQNSGTVNDIF